MQKTNIRGSDHISRFQTFSDTTMRFGDCPDSVLADDPDIQSEKKYLLVQKSLE